MSTKTFYERFSEWTRNSIMLRIASIAILVLLLLIPASMIEDLIRERSSYRDAAIREVSSKWGEEQTVTGPVLTLPYTSYFKDNEGKVTATTEYAHFLPESLTVETELSPETRYRGIYDVVVYTTAIHCEGQFAYPNIETLNLAEANVQWDDAYVSVGIPDMRGIEEAVALRWQQQKYPFDPGVASSDLFTSGISTPVGLDSAQRTISYQFDLQLKGSRSLRFMPLGRTTQVSVRSDWPNPSFDGAFLPDEREVDASGFMARWEVLHLNRNFPQAWKGSQYRFTTDADNQPLPDYYDGRSASVAPSASTEASGYSFGVNLLRSVDEYQKATRSAKYAILFISLTFLVFFFVETLNRKRIHPVQYLLVGLALCIFYALLVAISEQLSFNLAFGLSSVAVTALITLYCHSIFKQQKLTLFIGLLLVLLYGFVFTLLQLQDYALLIGSIGLFGILAVVMYFSRKIDWYALAEGEGERQEEATTGRK